MLQKLINWFKKKELEIIDSLEEKNKSLRWQVSNLKEALEYSEGKLSNAIKIANSKKVVTCYNTKCMDYNKETKSCDLQKIIIALGGRCEDYDDGSAMKELEQEVSSCLNVKSHKVYLDGKPITIAG